MDKRCAYCDRATPLTRDHVWPSCFLDRQGRTAAHFSVKTQRVHGADYVINDVCADCNANKLSALDAYFCSMYDQYFTALCDFDSTVIFRYDFHLLSRALLKIAYNSARSGGSNSQPLAAIRSYILGLAPPPRQFALFVEVVSPSLVRDDKAPSGVRKVMPEMYRSAITKFTKPCGERILTRIVAVNSFYFHLLLPLGDMSDADFELAATDFASSIEGVVRLVPGSAETTLTTSPQDGLRSMTPHLQAYGEQYREYFARNRDS